MENIRLMYENWFDSGVVTVNSEDSDFPASNLKHRWHTRPYFTTGVSSEWIKVDLGSALDVLCFVFKYHNFTSGATVKIQGNASDSWGSPSVDVTLVYDTDWDTNLGVYFWSSAQSYQWWRMTIADGGNGDGYLKLGRMYLGSYFSPIHNISRALRRKLVDPSSKMYSSGGQISTAQKSRYRVWDYDFQIVESPDNETFETIFDEVGQSKPYFICQDADDKLDTLFYVQNMTDWELQHLARNTYFSLGMTVEEMR